MFLYYLSFLLNFSFFNPFQLIILIINSGRRQMGMIINGVKPFLIIRMKVAKNSRIMDAPSMTVRIFSFFSLLSSSSSVYSVISLFLILFFVDDFKGIDASDRSYFDLFLIFFDIKIVNTVDVNQINGSAFSRTGGQNIVLF